LSDFPAWQAASSAGWQAIRLPTYCVSIPNEVQPVCLLGAGVDSCSFVIQPGNKRFSINVLPAGLARSSPDEFLLPDGTIAPLQQVTQGELNYQKFWELRSPKGSREIHVAPENAAFWVIVQYEGFNATEEIVADRVISTLLIPGRGPMTNDGPACPVVRTKKKI
jgi:hypothetical protein